MTTNSQDRKEIAEPGFAETNRGVQTASQGFDDGRANADAEERAKAWRAVLAGNLL